MQNRIQSYINHFGIMASHGFKNLIKRQKLILNLETKDTVNGASFMEERVTRKMVTIFILINKLIEKKTL